jgi:hypothetical protein
VLDIKDSSPEVQLAAIKDGGNVLDIKDTPFVQWHDFVLWISQFHPVQRMTRDSPDTHCLLHYGISQIRKIIQS